MRKIIFLLSCVLLVIGTSYGQAKKPRIMVVPSDPWCTANGYMDKIDDQGRVISVPNYMKALQENSELNQVISSIGNLMLDRGFELELLKEVLQGDENDDAAMSLLSSKNGASVSQSQFDKVYAARCDIIIEIDWQLKSSGFMNQVNYTMTGKDSYTRKQIAGGEPKVGNQLATDNVTVLLKSAVLSDIDNFNTQLRNHFDKLFEQGREVSIEVKKFDSWENDLETEYNGKELSVIIEDWMTDNTKNGRYTTAKASADQLVFKEVRIPLFDEKQRAIDARRFLIGLQNFLKAAPYNITSKIITKGLGQAALVLGSK